MQKKRLLCQRFKLNLETFFKLSLALFSIYLLPYPFACFSSSLVAFLVTESRIPMKSLGYV